ncbi:NAD(P)H-binding protein [Mucilaginibacter sp.]
MKSSIKTCPDDRRFEPSLGNLRPVYAEHELEEKLLAASNLNWTAVRPVALNDSQKIKTLKVSFNNSPKPSLQISRQSVAKFMVDIVKSDKYDIKSPNYF